jgi:hypothetical protein
MSNVIREEAKKRLKYIDEIEEWLEPFLGDLEALAEKISEENGDYEIPKVELAFEIIREALRLLILKTSLIHKL